MDIRTLFIISTITYFFLAFTLYLNWQTNKDRFNGVALWFYAMSSIALGFLLIAARGAINDFFSIVIANTAIIFGATLIYKGTKSFYGKTSSDLGNYALVLMILVSFYYFTFIKPVLYVRIALSFTAFAITILRCVPLIRFRSLSEKLSSWSIIICSSTLLLFSIGLILNMHLPEGNNFMVSGSPQFVPLVIVLLSLIGMSSGFMLTISNRLLNAERSLAEERKVLIKEMSHRVKNNLTVLESLMSLQARSITDDRSREYFQESTNRVHSIALIHDMLHKSDDMQRVNCNEYIHNLAGILARSLSTKNNRARVSCDVDSIDLDVDTLIPLGLIINELVTNSLKYAFRDSESGDISITFKEREKDTYELVVTDNGIGLPRDFDLNNPKSRGLLIVNSLVQQINGTLERTDSPGTEFMIAFHS